MGNDATCRTVEIDNICMKMFNGQVRILKDVRHAPDLRKIFFLLEALEAQGCKFSDTDEALKVTKSSITVLKVERTMNLYKVIESMVISDASIATEKDITRLWHMRLGHMSERSVRALHCKGVLPSIKHCELNLCKFCIMGG